MMVLTFQARDYIIHIHVPWLGQWWAVFWGLCCLLRWVFAFGFKEGEEQVKSVHLAMCNNYMGGD